MDNNLVMMGDAAVSGMMVKVPIMSSPLWDPAPGLGFNLFK